MIVRPAEPAASRRAPLRDMEVPEGLPERLHDMLVEVTHIRDDRAAYSRRVASTGSRSGSRQPLRVVA